jgi:small GTP-binding protein
MSSPTVEPKTIELKVVLVGSVGVGKTAMVMRFIKDQYKEFLETTIGASYMCKTLIIEGQPIKFSVWDTAGQEQYHSLVPLYFRKAAAVVVVYDITKYKSFEEAKQWVKELAVQAPEDVIIALTGAKCDLENAREVETRNGSQYAKSINALFTESSAKTSENVLQVFESIGQRFMSRLKDDKLNRDRELDADDETKHITAVDVRGGNNQSKCCGRN